MKILWQKEQCCLKGKLAAAAAAAAAAVAAAAAAAADQTWSVTDVPEFAEVAACSKQQKVWCKTAVHLLMAFFNGRH